MAQARLSPACFLIYKNWFYRRKQIFSNIPLYKIPYYRILNVKDLDAMSEGDVLLDEIWTLADSRMSLKKKNQFVANICARSRKKHLNIFASAQMVDQLDKRIRKIVDFTALPNLSPHEDAVRVSVFRSGFPKDSGFLKSFWYKTPIVFQMFDTDWIVDISEDEETEPMKIIFQESAETEPIYFDNWTDADKFSEDWWTKRAYLLKQIF